MEATSLKVETSGPATTTRPFRTAAVLGAGTMGSQIAAHLANAGLTVYLLDIAPEDTPDKDAIVDKLFGRAKKLKPNPFFTADTSDRIVTGNFDDDFHYLSTVDWVIEVVVERMDIKKKVLKRIDETIGPDTVVSSNTSGLPIEQISADCSADFKRRFLGTHFFNPPRYLKLFEVIPTSDTDPDVLDRVLNFARIHLGKGTVIAKDRPYFIGNRIGIYGMLAAIRKFTSGEYSIEEVDSLTGPLTGRPKSATFRTADVVGLDVMHHVISNLHEAVPEDESRDAFEVPTILGRLVEENRLGAKSRAGFYSKVGKEIRSINPETFEYDAGAPEDLATLGDIKRLGGLDERLRGLWEDQTRAGSFFRDTTIDFLGYASRRIPEVSDLPADVDRAIKWGFGWEKGPFEIWDAIGFEKMIEAMRDRGYVIPAWVESMESSGNRAFYRKGAHGPQVYNPGTEGYVADETFADEISLAAIKTNDARTIWSNGEAALLDLGDDVAILEFRSKANSLGQEVLAAIDHAIDFVEQHDSLRGLVIGNEGTNFSVGANLGEAAMAVAMGQFEMIEEYLGQFQKTIQRIRYAERPVVVAVHQRVLGGGCEMLMACPNPVAAAESYAGLVELGVGLIPAGTGSMRLAALADSSAANGHDSEIQSFLMKYFEQVAMARVATSAEEAREMGYLPQGGIVVMNEARRFHVAKERVQFLSSQGYLPPPVHTAIRVLGRPAAAAMVVGATQFMWGKFISEYDLKLAGKLAHVLTGGDLTGPAEVHEDYLLELEREAFLSLLGEEKTMERVQHILTTNKPLRN